MARSDIAERWVPTTEGHRSPVAARGGPLDGLTLALWTRGPIDQREADPTRIYTAELPATFATTRAAGTYRLHTEPTEYRWEPAP